MKKKQNYNPLQLSFFDEVVNHNNGDKDNLLEKNWKSVVDHFASEGTLKEKEKQSNNHLKTSNNERDLSESNRGKRPGLSDADQRGNRIDVPTSVEGEGTLRNA